MRFFKSSSRSTPIELLRILSMLFIILSHSSVHGNYPEGPSVIPFNNIFLEWAVLGNLGVDIFFLISGYFLCGSTSAQKSMPRLLSQVWFYSIFSFVISLLLGNHPLPAEISAAFFPTLFAEYWFFTVYFIILLLCPYINIFLHHASQKQFIVCLATLLAIWSIVPTFTMQAMYGAELAQCLLLYLIGAYFKMYPSTPFRSTVLRTTMLIVSFVLLFGSSLMGLGIRLYSRNSILIIGCAVSLFCVAIYHQPYTNSFINAVSGCTFGVYLLHDNPFIRTLLWSQWLQNNRYYNSPLLPLALLASTVIVFVTCTCIEYLRKKFLADITERGVAKLLDVCYQALHGVGYGLYNLAKHLSH